MGTRHLRLIARLDIKGPNLIKGVQLEGLRVAHDAQPLQADPLDEVRPLDVQAGDDAQVAHGLRGSPQAAPAARGRRC